MHRKNRVLEALQYLCNQQPQQRGTPGRCTGFSAEEVAEQASVDRTNASRDLNSLAQEGIIERFPGRPVLFSIKRATQEVERDTTPKTELRPAHYTPHPVISSTKEHSEVAAAISASLHTGAAITSFETLIGSNDGLKVAIQQAKAAILYPPRGLHTLLCGPSGVGKTTFARLMHDFALELHALPADAPFISFNCADYAGNPQLLMALLFGVVRGAYTGAERDREGLVEQAHRGILFLDEVHRLPPEGQEMLFYLMDRERFRRLGDVRERQSSLQLLAATTEDPTTALLPTFRRRIPMTIALPGLREWSISERYELVRAFFTGECSSIGSNIHVSPQVLKAFLLYECSGNIGQLRTDVQLTCAHAYLEYRTNNLQELHIDMDTLPEHIRRGLLRTADLHRTLEPVQQLLEVTHIFTPTGLSLNNQAQEVPSLYDTISNELVMLRNSGLSAAEVHKLLYLDIQHYFQHFADTVSHERTESSTNLVDALILTQARFIVQFAEEHLERSFPEKLALVLALHLTSALEHTASGHSVTVPVIASVRQTYPVEYEVAQLALLRLRSELDLSLPEGEADVLAVLFANADTLLSNQHSHVGLVIAAHGRGIAAGLAELANTLVGVSSVSALELMLEQSPDELLAQVEQSPDELLAQVEQRIAEIDRGSGVLLFVDFSSLLSVGELITQRTGIQVRTVAGVSAPLVVEAVRRAQRYEHVTLDQLAASLLLFHTTEDSSRDSRARNEQRQSLLAPKYTNTTHTINPADGPITQPRVILSVCLTGYGSAIKLAELLGEQLPELSLQGIETICMDINLSGKTESEVQRLVGERQVVAIVGTINPHVKSYPFISLTEILFGDGITRLRTLLGGTLIDPAIIHPPASSDNSAPTFTKRSDLVREITYTLNQRLLFLNPQRALPLIERMIEMIEVEVGETFDIEVLSGLIVHLACVLERGPQSKGLFVSEALRMNIRQHYARELEICKRAWQVLSTQIARSLPEEEAYNIVGILRQVNIFE